MESKTTTVSRNLGILIWCLVSLVAFFVVLFNSTEADRNVAANTLWLGGLVALIALPLGALTAWAAIGRYWTSRLLLISCVGLLAVPLFSHVSAWDSALGRLGWLPATQGEVLKPILSGWPAGVWIHAVAATPQVAIIFLLGLATGRRVYEEQALLETSRMSVFWHVTFPRLAPIGLLAATWILIICSREIAVTDIFRIGTLAEQVYLGFSLGQFNSIQGNWTVDQIANAQSLGPFVSVVLIGWISITASWFFSRLTSLEFESNQWRPLQNSGSSSSIKKTIAAFLILVILVAIPIGNLIYRASFFVTSIDGKPTPSFSLDQFGNSIARVFSQFPTEFYWSTIIALVSATLIIVAVVFLTWAARRSNIWQIIFIVLLTLSCAIPGPMFGSWISKAFTATSNPGVAWLYDRTIFAPVLTTCFFCWPIAGLVIWFVFRKTSVDALESARLEGASWLNQLFRIAIPSHHLSIAGAWLITFALCFGELSATQMVLPPGMDTVPRLTLGLLHAGVDEMTAALTIVTVCGIILISLTGWLLVRLNHWQDQRK